LHFASSGGGVGASLMQLTLFCVCPRVRERERERERASTSNILYVPYFLFLLTKMTNDVATVSSLFCLSHDSSFHFFSFRFKTRNATADFLLLFQFVFSSSSRCLFASQQRERLSAASRQRSAALVCVSHFDLFIGGPPPLQLLLQFS